MNAIHNIPTALIICIVAAIILELTMKGFALWKAAKSGQSKWFVAILLINTAGILPLIYMKFFSRTDNTSIK